MDNPLMMPLALVLIIGGACLFSASYVAVQAKHSEHNLELETARLRAATLERIVRNADLKDVNASLSEIDKALKAAVEEVRNADPAMDALKALIADLEANKLQLKDKTLLDDLKRRIEAATKLPK